MIVLVRSFGILAKIIHAGMYLWYVIRARKPRKVYNHADIYIKNMVSGALAKGVTNRTYHEAYIKDDKRRELLIYDMGLSIRQEGKLYNFCLSQSETPYEYINFLRHTIDIFFGKWKGPKGKKAEKRVYCIEYAAMGINKVFPGSIKKPWKINPIRFKEYCDERFGLPQKIRIQKS